MDNQLVSVIIPTYKRRTGMVERAVKSVLNQSYQKLEIIIVDDSPADFEFRDAIKNMLDRLNDDRVSYIRHVNNMGACAARNTGIEAAKGTYLAFLDDDDEWLPEKLEKQIKKIKIDKIGLVYCKQIVINDTLMEKKINNRKCYSGMVFDKLIMDNFIGSTSFVLVKKECFQNVGMFNTKMESAQDGEMWLRIAKTYQVDYVDEPLVIYHVHGEERITTNAYKKIQGLEALNNIYAEYLEKHKEVKAIRLIKIVPYYIEVKKVKKAWNIYCQAVRLAPFSIYYNLKYLKCFVKWITKMGVQ